MKITFLEQLYLRFTHFLIQFNRKKEEKMRFKKMLSGSVIFFCALCLTAGCTEEKIDEKLKEEVKGNCTIVECMKKIEATNTMEEMNDIIGFESTTDATIGSDPIWKFDSKNWISYKTYGNDNITIQATIDKESIKDDKIKLPSSSDLQKNLNNGSFTYEELAEKVGGEGTLTSISKGSLSYTWVDKSGQKLGATFNKESGKCTVASYR